MLNKHKYWKSLLGTFAEALIGKQVEYTDDATFQDFVANAVEGEIGIFNASTNATIAAGFGAVAADVWVFAALKKDGLVEKTNRFRRQDFELVRAPYAAAVAQVSTATLGGTPVAGKYYAVKILETTPGYQAFPTWEYGYVAKSGDTPTAVAAAIVAKINDTANIVNVNTDPVVTASNAAGVITLTAKSAGITFKIAFSADALADLAAVAAYTGGGTANGSWGNGTYDQVAELEKETNVFKGVTTQYPNQGTNPEDFGQPTAFATVGVQYNIYIARGFDSEVSPTPVERHYQPRTIVLAIPANGAANPEAEVKEILGL